MNSSFVTWPDLHLQLPTQQQDFAEAIDHLLAKATASTMVDSHLTLSNYQLTQAPSSASIMNFWRVLLDPDLVDTCLFGLHLVRPDFIWFNGRVLVWCNMVGSSWFWYNLLGSKLVCYYLVCSSLFWLDLVWSGWLWFGLV